MENKILIAITCLCLGLLIGLRQQHLQKDYMIKTLTKNQKVEVQQVTSDFPKNLPMIDIK